ncbi:UDP-3-O-(3-hydroxymyristoyl)glucosamine N-acyltransferase [Propionispora vibrioides]|uniref:UDP-3-O-[3-hydroxymyristoyl] glucosamine N-acyltransferase n=1 Tax=Propionispora vibrioides TaxID=112903 RepID=A0A1H8RW98_9FIRM|nr:UDP-3-O-(3-hydroxymyristoyl)glucosamine N-acyltransferase [Propionispora vibrioides]SEO70642.1 UDP-3-O-[3-hydroxymyristoyl] glucosamine N-acyltransferase [Propionispora vibrioides]
MLVSDIDLFKSLYTRNVSFSHLGFVSSLESELLSFCESEEYVNDINNSSNIVCLITTKELASSFNHKLRLIINEKPKQLFYEVHNYLFEKTSFYQKDISSFIADTSRIYPKAYIAERNIHIGNNVVIEPNVTILENVFIDDNVIIRSGSVIGSEGFQYVRSDNGILSVKHAGGVVLKKNVEIGANCCIDKGVFGENTVLEENTKLDNLVHIAHACRIGRRCLLAAGVIVAGSSIVGDDVWIGPGAIISNQISIGKESFVSLGSVVIKNMPQNSYGIGNPCRFAIK